MFRLGLRLALKGGREAFTRLLVTALAVMVGVAILLSVLADFHAYQKTSNRAAWESTQGAAISKQSLTSKNGTLWNYSENIYKGQFIEQLDVAALGKNAPVIPGLTHMPSAGQYYVSPALAQLLKTVPKDQLGDRFVGTQVGTISKEGLAFPTELAIVVGYSPAQLVQMPHTVVVTKVASTPELQGTTNMYRIAFGIGIIAILFPLLILINTATRLSASRREERYAAMRLVGATPNQVNVVASVEAIIGALIGSLLGIAVFLAARPVVADISFSGVKFFPDYVTPTIWGYIGMAVLVPVAAAIASLVSLRRVRISPLGVSRRVAPPKPRVWRLVPLALGVLMFVITAVSVSPKSQTALAPLFVGFLLILVGLVMSGAWLTMWATNVLARYARSASSLLAARRLADNPQAAFRSVSGVILAVFIGSVISVYIPALHQAQSPTSVNSLTNVLRASYTTSPTDLGLSPKDATALVSKLQSYSGVSVLPLYVNPAFTAFVKANMMGPANNGNGPTAAAPNIRPPKNAVVSCASLQQMNVLGTCKAGVSSVTMDSMELLGDDNPLSIYRGLPYVTQDSQEAAANLKALPVSGLLIKTKDAATLERVRTYLTNYNAAVQSQGSDNQGIPLTVWRSGALEPETIGEVAQIRNNDDANIGRVVWAVIVLTLVTAGCSLAVTVGGSLIERKRPFALLRVSGTPLAALYKVVLLEAALPLVAVSVFAAVVGLAVAIPVVKALLRSLGPQNVVIPVHPTGGYYIALGAGLLVSLALVTLTLPLLGRISKPEDARFE